MAVNGLCWVRRNDPQKRFLATIVVITIICNWACSSTAQTVGDVGLCSTTERSTMSYTETYQSSRTHQTYEKCGFLNWDSCTRYRPVYSIETRVAYRDSYNIVFACCNGWIMQPDGSCKENVTEETSTQSESSSTMTPSRTKKTTPTLDGNTAIFVLSSSSVPFSTGLPGSSPGEIAKSDSPRSLGKGSGAPDDAMIDGKHIGMIGGLVGVAVALVVMVSLMAVFMSRRKRRSREKRRNSDPGVVFELLNGSSPGRVPTPAIYTEIGLPDRDTSTNIAGGTAADNGPKDTSAYDFDIAFKNTKQPSELTNTYQEMKEPGSRRDKPKEVSNGSPAIKKVDMEVRLQKNGAVFSKTHDRGKQEVGSPYQNVPGLDVVIQPSEIYDFVGGGTATPAAYSNLDTANSKPVIPTDPNDEAYNIIIIGPTGGDKVRYDKLERHTGSGNSGGELDTPIPVAPGYSKLGVDSHLGYDKLARNEAHNGDTEKKTATIGPNAYNELGVQGRKAGYDKLDRRQSDDKVLGDSGSRSGTLNGLTNGNLPRNEYDTIRPTIGKPADGEIYENLPKKPAQSELAVKIPCPDVGEQMSTPSPLTSSVVRPVYDVIPGSQRTPSSPVYDILPNSPESTFTTPVYDTPPASLKTTPQVGCEEPASSGVGGGRPVYDTPPVRTNITCPLQFEETSPLYENTRTGRR